MLKIPTLQSHRGFHSQKLVKGDLVKENTLNSLLQAHELGYKMVEFDVQLSADHVPVLFHDDNLSETFGIDKKISEFSYEDLKTKFEIDSLEKIFNCHELDQMIFNIELKNPNLLNGFLEIEVCRLVKKYEAEGRVLFSSFKPWSLWRVRSILPNVSRALIVTDEVEEGNYWFLRKMILNPFLDLTYLHVRDQMVTVDRLFQWLSDLPEYGGVAVWTVNDTQRAKELIKMGVLSVITDSVTVRDLGPVIAKKNLNEL